MDQSRTSMPCFLFCSLIRPVLPLARPASAGQASSEEESQECVHDRDEGRHERPGQFRGAAKSQHLQLLVTILRTAMCSLVQCFVVRRIQASVACTSFLCVVVVIVVVAFWSYGRWCCRVLASRRRRHGPGLRHD